MGLLPVHFDKDTAMNAPLAKEQIKLLMSDSLTYRSPASAGMDGADTKFRPQRPGTLKQWFSRAFAAVAAIPHRQAVLRELAQLSDRELADIGLNRAELTRVFDPRFNQARRT